MKPRWILAIGALVLFVGAMPSHAQWSTDPTVNNAICTATNTQYHPTIVSDGAGGAIITWADSRSGSFWDIYAQRINASGVVQWAADGVAICTATYHQSSPTIVSDGAGGAIIAWHDSRSGSNNIYAQRINASGIVQWTVDGVAICTATGDQSPSTIVSDGAGGAIIMWQDRRSGNYYNPAIYAQRVNASGVVQWTADGVAVCTGTNTQYPGSSITIDGAGGAIITWQDGRSGSYSTSDIYAQRINALGVVEWSANGVAICTEMSYQSSPTIVSDGAGGAIITWYDSRDDQPDIYAQRINASGLVQWTTDGVAICMATNAQWSPTIVSDGADGAIIRWDDHRSGSNWDIYVQRINASGVGQWTADGVAIFTATGYQYASTIVSDGAGGAIITWWGNRSGSADIYAQRINTSGVVQWPADGVAICTAASYQSSPKIVSDGAGGAIITWFDYRSGGYSTSDIYAQRVCRDGTLGGNLAPLADAGTAQTVIVSETVQLDGSGSSDPDGDPITYSWEITSKPDGSSATLSNLAIVNPTLVADKAGEYKILLVVNDGTVNSAPDEVIITAITAQQAIGSLIDQINALVSSGDLEANQAKPLTDKLTAIIALLDKDKIEVAINQLETFINMVNADINSDKLKREDGEALIDAANAIIAALNAGGVLPKNAPRDFLDHTSNIPPVEFRLEQNSPNPFNPITTIQFAVPRESYVRLKVYDSFGAEVAVLVDQQIAPGTYKVNWDASRLASGFYLYRLEAEGLALTKKLLLMK